MSQPQNPQLEATLAQLHWKVRPERFVLVGLAPRERQLVSRLLPVDVGPFLQLFIEPDMVTLILSEADWREISPAFPRARIQRPYRVISFPIDLPADLTGFLAAISAALAEAQVPLLAACGFSKDHLLVREEDLDAATAALDRLANRSRRD